MSIPALLALVGVAAAGLTVAWLLIRSRDKWPALPAWEWTDIRKAVALVATIAGAAVLTAIIWWVLDYLFDLAKGLIGELMRDPRARPEVGAVLVDVIDAITWGLKLLVAGVLVVLLSLGFVITPRSFEFHGPAGLGGKFGGGEEADAKARGAKEVADAADAKAEQIEAQAQPSKPDDPRIPDYAKP